MCENIKKIISTICVRIFYPASSLSIMLLVYATNNICDLVDGLPNISYLGNDCIDKIIRVYSNNCIVRHILIYLFVLFIIGILLYLATRFDNLSKDATENLYQIDKLEPAERGYMPIYLSYFFVALSFKSVESLAIGFSIFYVLSLLTEAMSFNPLLLIMGYRFLNLKNAAGKQIMIIVKKDKLDTITVKFDNLRRINDYTFYQD